MGFKMRKRRKFEKAEEFMTRIKEVHKKVEAILKKSQEEIKNMPIEEGVKWKNTE